MFRRTFQREYIRRAADLPTEHLWSVRLVAVSVLRHLQLGATSRLRRAATARSATRHHHEVSITYDVFRHIVVRWYIDDKHMEFWKIIMWHIVCNILPSDKLSLTEKYFLIKISDKYESNSHSDIILPKFKISICHFKIWT